MLKYKEFKKAVKAIKYQMKHDKECSKAFEVILPDSMITFYDNFDVIQAVIDLLTITMDDKYSLIESFIYETNFGKKDIVMEIDGEEVQLNSIRSLYGMLLYFNDDKKTKLEEDVDNINSYIPPGYQGFFIPHCSKNIS
jgi:hypothetical protein